MNINAWLNASMTAFFTVIKKRLDEPKTLAEYIDKDPVSPQNGEQWIRINSVPQAGLVMTIGGMPIVNQTPTLQVCTQTSQGIV